MIDDRVPDAIHVRPTPANKVVTAAHMNCSVLSESPSTKSTFEKDFNSARSIRKLWAHRAPRDLFPVHDPTESHVARATTPPHLIKPPSQTHGQHDFISPYPTQLNASSLSLAGACSPGVSTACSPPSYLNAAISASHQAAVHQFSPRSVNSQLPPTHPNFPAPGAHVHLCIPHPTSSGFCGCCRGCRLRPYGATTPSICTADTDTNRIAALSNQHQETLDLGSCGSSQGIAPATFNGSANGFVPCTRPHACGSLSVAPEMGGYMCLPILRSAAALDTHDLKNGSCTEPVYLSNGSKAIHFQQQRQRHSRIYKGTGILHPSCFQEHNAHATMPRKVGKGSSLEQVLSATDRAIDDDTISQRVRGINPYGQMTPLKEAEESVPHCEWDIYPNQKRLKSQKSAPASLPTAQLAPARDSHMRFSSEPLLTESDNLWLEFGVNAESPGFPANGLAGSALQVPKEDARSNGWPRVRTGSTAGLDHSRPVTATEMEGNMPENKADMGGGISGPLTALSDLCGPSMIVAGSQKAISVHVPAAYGMEEENGNPFVDHVWDLSTEIGSLASAVGNIGAPSENTAGYTASDVATKAGGGGKDECVPRYHLLWTAPSASYGTCRAARKAQEGVDACEEACGCMEALLEFGDPLMGNSMPNDVLLEHDDLLPSPCAIETELLGANGFGFCTRTCSQATHASEGPQAVRRPASPVPLTELYDTLEVVVDQQEHKKAAFLSTATMRSTETMHAEPLQNSLICKSIDVKGFRSVDFIHEPSEVDTIPASAVPTQAGFGVQDIPLCEACGTLQNVKSFILQDMTYDLFHESKMHSCCGFMDDNESRCLKTEQKSTGSCKFHSSKSVDVTSKEHDEVAERQASIPAIQPDIPLSSTNIIQPESLIEEHLPFMKARYTKTKHCVEDYLDFSKAYADLTPSLAGGGSSTVDVDKDRTNHGMHPVSELQNLLPVASLAATSTGAGRGVGEMQGYVDVLEAQDSKEKKSLWGSVEAGASVGLMHALGTAEVYCISRDSEEDGTVDGNLGKEAACTSERIPPEMSQEMEEASRRCQQEKECNDIFNNGIPNVSGSDATGDMLFLQHAETAMARHQRKAPQQANHGTSNAFEECRATATRSSAGARTAGARPAGAGTAGARTAGTRTCHPSANGAINALTAATAGARPVGSTDSDSVPQTFPTKGKQEAVHNQPAPATRPPSSQASPEKVQSGGVRVLRQSRQGRQLRKSQYRGVAVKCVSTSLLAVESS
jgi:hypothetical protein